MLTPYQRSLSRSWAVDVDHLAMVRSSTRRDRESNSPFGARSQRLPVGRARAKWPMVEAVSCRSLRASVHTRPDTATQIHLANYGSSLTLLVSSASGV